MIDVDKLHHQQKNQYSFEKQTPRQSSYLLFLSMMYITVMLCSGVLTHRLIQLGPVYTMGGTIVAPLWFILSDVIAEIYGYKIAKKIVWFGFVCQVLFSIACYFIIQIKGPSFANNQTAYFVVLGSMLHTCLSAFVAYITAGFINIYFITKWKVLLKGQYFWLRSLGASVISELIFTVLAVFLIQVGKISMSKILTIIAVSYSLKVICSIVLAFPVNLLVAAIKRSDNIDVYDERLNFNPFNLAS